MEEYWANNTFNPYSDTFLKFPFNISFSDTVYASPIDRKKVVTSRYGWRWGRPHHGIDIDLISGDNVRAILDGKVRYVRYHGGHGRTVVIRHENGLETVYAHLSKQLVKENDTVVKGQIIGKGGVTGNARGSHLHLEVRYQGKSINPEYLFDFNKENNIRSKELWVTKKWTNPLKHRSTRRSRVTVYTTEEEAILGKEAESTVYIIRKGDTLWKIARMHQLSVNQLCRLNSIKKTSKLRIGQRIVLN
ncbi:peptidoglycan DD-metalloendopeptidase family protein [Flavobacteriaceae bacterium R38]|nr:peptidoglycan DD-metalloendopeptidase family protein [Flavobacteriaceae bacterium R38]